MKTKDVAFLGLLLAVTLILSYAETLIPLPVSGIPGIKLGLANLSIVLALEEFGERKALLIDLLKVVLTGFLFGTMSTILYALCGAMVSLLIMILLRKTGIFSVVGISIGGGIFHNLAQLLLAGIIIESYSVVSYIPFLLISGVVTGAMIGIVANVLLPYIDRIRRSA